jgi:hypothetical protein
MTYNPRDDAAIRGPVGGVSFHSPSDVRSVALSGGVTEWRSDNSKVPSVGDWVWVRYVDDLERNGPYVAAAEVVAQVADRVVRLHWLPEVTARLERLPIEYSDLPRTSGGFRELTGDPRAGGRMSGLDFLSRWLRAADPLVEAEEKRTGDGRNIVRRRIRAAIVRDQQDAFRRALLASDGAACAVTGPCDEAALEAAHVTEVEKEGSYELGNGLLLRADLHRLFDRGLLLIDGSGVARVYPAIADTAYGRSLLSGPRVRRLPDAWRLKARWTAVEWSGPWRWGSAGRR